MDSKGHFQYIHNTKARLSEVIRFQQKLLKKDVAQPTNGQLFVDNYLVYMQGCLGRGRNEQDISRDR
ncbi:MAG: hypothetical protein WBP64_21605 [Nitrososphaeraceae archaeon]